jgi:hypothetical protein
MNADLVARHTVLTQMTCATSRQKQDEQECRRHQTDVIKKGDYLLDAESAVYLNLLLEIP